MSKRKSIIVILIVLINSVFVNSLNAQSRIDSLQNIKQLIQKDNTVSNEVVGYRLAPSKYWCAFIYLLYLATSEELGQMTDDKSPALRIYTYVGLIYNKYPDLKKIKKKLYNDKESVYTSFGCIGKDMDVTNCTKQFIKHYYYEDSIDELLSILKNNEKYRNQLYDDLTSGRNISRPPYE